MLAGMAKKNVTKLAKQGAAAVARNVRRGNDALKLISRKMELIAEAFYDIALALVILQRKEIYAALGAKSFAELVEERTPLSRSVAFELVKLPAHLSREAAIALGRDKADALIRHVEHTEEDDDAEELYRADAKIGRKAISAQTAVGIDEATKKLPSQRDRKPRPGEEQANAAAHRLETALHAAGARKAHVVSVKRADGWWLRIDVPADASKKLSVRKPAR
jgi:hypothetical protein